MHPACPWIEQITLCKGRAREKESVNLISLAAFSVRSGYVETTYMAITDSRLPWGKTDFC